MLLNYKTNTNNQVEKYLMVTKLETELELETKLETKPKFIRKLIYLENKVLRFLLSL